MAIWLNEQDVRELLPMRDLIETMARALAAFSSGQVDQPVRTVIQAGGEHSFFGTMPAFSKNIPALGAKLVTVFGDNAAKGLPTHLATILLLDPETGALLAVMDGRFITEARTAAVTAVAVRSLAQENASTLAILGSGVQARSHLEALGLVRNFREVRCWSPTRANLERFAAESQAYPVRVSGSAEEAVRSADVVVLVTASPKPVIRNEWVKNGACVAGVGACRPNQREMDPALVARSRLFVDSREAALQESGDVVMSIQEGLFGPDHIVAELGEVLSGGRRNSDEVTVFKSLGMAIEDVASADLVYRRAQQMGRGSELG
jgi:alanine dehydrogenase